MTCLKQISCFHHLLDRRVTVELFIYQSTMKEISTQTIFLFFNGNVYYLMIEETYTYERHEEFKKKKKKKTLSNIILWIYFFMFRN